MKPEVRVFTKDSPCTKYEIWQCFRAASGFVQVAVPDAQALIGANVPRVMEREGRLVRRPSATGPDYYALTEEGKDWLLRGFKAYLKNHPLALGRSKFVPRVWARDLRRAK